MMRKIFSVVGICSLVVALTVGSGDAFSATPPAEVEKCQACHGADGNSSSGTVPRLNGQQSEYLAVRLRSFRDLTRQSPHATYFMWGINSSIGDKAASLLTRYYAAQHATQSDPRGVAAKEGRILYQKGDGQHIAPCQNCHGVKAEGDGLVPRLAGQHADYLRQQLQSFSLMVRLQNPMNAHSRHMSQNQINALVAYLARD